ncbi:hypothetical protein V1498_15455 [Peribacillus sp. SCS-26]|uniref:hypothetical protein n=1 Tax=Paraperibacillus marinus TaxID=3115295 RepID=UPI003905E022
MMTTKKLEELYAELSDLQSVESAQNTFVAQLRTEHATIKDVMALSSSWRSGQGFEAFSEEAEQYFQDFSSSINFLQGFIADIKAAIVGIEAQIQQALKN